ncbi:MAG: beta-lactamase family protein [Actinobacteria bacterium]|nr:beta-lactamase family protein [Actinomycetota bacterium]
MTDALGQVITDRLHHTHEERGLPSLAVAVGHRGEPVWVGQVGVADVASGRPVTGATAYRIGSVTKTFTAALVLLFTERGVLDLDEPVEAYLPGTSVGRPRLRQLLAHSGGVQREAPLPMWASMQGPDAVELREALRRAELVDEPGVRWHYSNLGYAILGQVVHQVGGAPCEELIDRELLAPLGLTATTWQPPVGAATGYRLDPYSDTLHREPVMQQGTIGVGGQLWSTTSDLLTWGHALLGGNPEVLPASVTDAMRIPQVMVDRQRWTQGWGLGLILDRRGDRVVSGHTGAMPGFLASLTMDEASGVVVAALTNVTRGVRLGGLAANILDDTVCHLPPPPGVTRAPVVSRACQPGLVGVLGRWWCEAEETVFTWRENTLHAHLADSPTPTDTAFVEVAVDEYRASDGRLKGERLRIIRDENGTVDHLDWAGYPYTRAPR